MSRGQTEIFGLVMIVILVSLGLLFAVVVLTKKPTSQVQKLKESVQAANLLHTAMGTTVPDCRKRTVRQLLQDCAVAGVSGPSIVGATLCEDGLNTCEKADFVISELLLGTLNEWGRTYEFFITGTQAAQTIRASNGNCSGLREGTIRPEKIRSGLDVNLTLYVC